jgi:hypothetical protein
MSISPQLERLQAELQKIKPNVTKKDRLAFRAIGHSYRCPNDNTILNYLNGKGSSADVAYDLLAFFKKRIEEREEILK